MQVNNRDRVLKAYCAERLKGTQSAGQAAALRAAHAVVVGKVVGHRFIAWTAEAEKMCLEEFDARDREAKRERSERNSLSQALIDLHRRNPWHGSGWRDGVEALIKVYGEPMVTEQWTTVQEYLREQAS